ncbi:MAG: tRNA (adenosine(37)-N6)-dimethylallyltransferase MiaA [Pseudomonadota bacterium]
MALDLKALDTERPLLIAGPTACGKSALAMQIAAAQGRRIINADALQVFDDWRVLTARPSPADEAALPHALYGHIPGSQSYSVGHWLRDLRELLSEPAVVVGGTGLYFSGLTEGLAEIPPTPDAVRKDAMARLDAEGPASLLAELDAETAARIDTRNPMRVQRAWEVLTTTGRGLARWQAETGPPLLPLRGAQTILMDAPKDWLTPRIEQRFDSMLTCGALEEARENASDWSPDRPSAKAIGAAELIAHIRGDMSLADAREAAIVATRQYAKRQRSWFRARMADWNTLPAGDVAR